MRIRICFLPKSCWNSDEIVKPIFASLFLLNSNLERPTLIDIREFSRRSPDKGTVWKKQNKKCREGSTRNNLDWICSSRSADSSNRSGKTRTSHSSRWTWPRQASRRSLKCVCACLYRWYCHWNECSEEAEISNEVKCSNTMRRGRRCRRKERIINNRTNKCDDEDPDDSSSIKTACLDSSFHFQRCRQEKFVFIDLNILLPNSIKYFF